MSEYKKSVPRNPMDSDETLKAVLELIIFQTADGDELSAYELKSDKIVLTFEATD